MPRFGPCQTCRYRNFAQECERFPPDAHGRRPRVALNHGCGEWEVTSSQVRLDQHAERMERVRLAHDLPVGVVSEARKAEIEANVQRRVSEASAQAMARLKQATANRYTQDAKAFGLTIFPDVQDKTRPHRTLSLMSGRTDVLDGSPATDGVFVELAARASSGTEARLHIELGREPTPADWASVATQMHGPTADDTGFC